MGVFRGNSSALPIWVENHTSSLCLNLGPQTPRLSPTALVGSAGVDPAHFYLRDLTKLAETPPKLGSYGWLGQVI